MNNTSACVATLKSRTNIHSTEAINFLKDLCDAGLLPESHLESVTTKKSDGSQIAEFVAKHSQQSVTSQLKS